MTKAVMNLSDNTSEKDRSNCPLCGAELTHGVDRCPGCGLDHSIIDRVGDQIEKKEEDVDELLEELDQQISQKLQNELRDEIGLNIYESVFGVEKDIDMTPQGPDSLKKNGIDLVYECGNCGSSIPRDANRCYNCNVVFEEETEDQLKSEFRHLIEEAKRRSEDVSLKGDSTLFLEQKMEEARDHAELGEYEEGLQKTIEVIKRCQRLNDFQDKLDNVWSKVSELKIDQARFERELENSKRHVERGKILEGISHLEDVKENVEQWKEKEKKKAGKKNKICSLKDNLNEVLEAAKELKASLDEIKGAISLAHSFSKEGKVDEALQVLEHAEQLGQKVLGRRIEDVVDQLKGNGKEKMIRYLRRATEEKEESNYVEAADWIKKAISVTSYVAGEDPLFRSKGASYMRKIPSGVSDLDAIIKGGLPTGSVVILSTEVGAGGVEFTYTSAAKLLRARNNPDDLHLILGDECEGSVLPNDVHYVTFSKDKEDLFDQVKASFNRDYYEVLENDLKVEDLSSSYFQQTMVPPSWTDDQEPGESLFSDDSDTDLLEKLVDFLEENAENNVIIIDSLTDLLTNSSIDNEKLVTIIKGMRRASKKWGGVIYLLLTKGIVEKSTEYLMVDSVDGVFSFEWSKNRRSSRRQRYLLVDKFMSVLPHLKREKIARFTAEVKDTDGYTVINYEKIR